MCDIANTLARIARLAAFTACTFYSSLERLFNATKCIRKCNMHGMTVVRTSSRCVVVAATTSSPEWVMAMHTAAAKKLLKNVVRVHKITGATTALIARTLLPSLVSNGIIARSLLIVA